MKNGEYRILQLYVRAIIVVMMLFMIAGSFVFILRSLHLDRTPDPTLTAILLSLTNILSAGATLAIKELFGAIELKGDSTD